MSSCSRSTSSSWRGAAPSRHRRHVATAWRPGHPVLVARHQRRVLGDRLRGPARRLSLRGHGAVAVRPADLRPSHPPLHPYPREPTSTRASQRCSRWAAADCRRVRTTIFCGPTAISQRTRGSSTLRCSCSRSPTPPRCPSVTRSHRPTASRFASCRSGPRVTCPDHRRPATPAAPAVLVGLTWTVATATARRRRPGGRMRTKGGSGAASAVGRLAPGRGTQRARQAIISQGTRGRARERRHRAGHEQVRPR